MKSAWFKRLALVASVAAAALVAGCGSGSVASAIKPARFLAVGDSFADVGQKGYRFSVHDGTPTWTEDLAGKYGLTITPASAGGNSYAQGYARVAQTDTSGYNAPSVTQQIDALLARTTFANDDVMIVAAGVSDVVAEVKAGGISAATTANVKAAGAALGGQIRRLVAAGAKHVVVAGVYNLGNTPWGRAMDQRTALAALSVDFNNAVKLSVVDMGAEVLFVDAALLYNLVDYRPQNYTLTNAVDPVCTTPDATTCTPSTLVAGIDYTKYLWADSINMTPAGLRVFSGNDYIEGVYYKLRTRW